MHKEPGEPSACLERVIRILVKRSKLITSAVRSQ